MVGALVVLTAACSSSGASARPPLEPAVRTYTQKFLAGDGEAAFSMLSSRCQRNVGLNGFKVIAAKALEQFGDATITTYRDDINGSKATATYELSDATLNQTDEPWLFENGAWHNDDCS